MRHMIWELHSLAGQFPSVEMLSVAEKVKLVVTGSSGVGKTNTVRRIRNEAFLDLHKSTSGKFLHVK